jgi:hypothetical protein
MSVRSIKPKSIHNAWGIRFEEFPKEKDGIIYVRQSSLVQQQNNIHSFEMQTEKFEEHFRQMGCTGNITIIADDEAMSGTLDIHQRPGLSRVMRLIEQEKIGWVGAVAVNRLTRDPWLVTPGTIMKECHKHNVWIATLRMHFNFKDDYCQRVFMLEAEEAARHLEWMKLVLGGAKAAASSNGYYDGRFVAPGYIVDRSDPLRKKYVIYAPHAEIVFWLFKRFLELDGNFPALCREVEKLPYVFPRFEDWVDKKTIGTFRLHRLENLTPEGHYKVFRGGLLSILTNPVYIGWWLPLDGGVIENNHEPIVEDALFTYAHKRLSTFDLQGKRQKPERVSRNGEAHALLKKVIAGTNGMGIYPSTSKNSYRCYEYRQAQIIRERFALSIKHIDAVFLEKLFERLRKWEGCEDWEDKIEQKREAREVKTQLIKRQIREIDEKLTEIEDTVNTPGCPKSLKTKLFHDYEGLEAKKQELQTELKEDPEHEMEDDEILFQIESLFPVIVEQWDDLSFETKMRIINALVQKVIIDHPAPSWYTIEIEWKREDWGVDRGQWLQYPYGGSHWTAEEDTLLRDMYPTRDAGDILTALPSRNWSGIRTRAMVLGIKRLRTTPNTIPVNNPRYVQVTYEDILYAEKEGLVLEPKSVQWSRPSAWARQ